MRYESGGTSIAGLPKSALRDLSRKLVFVPAGYEYNDWQDPRILTRVLYFYFDPTGLAISPEVNFSNMSFAPRLFFEDQALWETALKLAHIDRKGPVRTTGSISTLSASCWRTKPGTGQFPERV